MIAFASAPLNSVISPAFFPGAGSSRAASGLFHLNASVATSPMICAIADKIYALSEGHIMAEITDRDQIKPEVCEKYL